MSQPQPDPDQFNEMFLVRMWACIYGVEVHTYDDFWCEGEGDTFPVGAPFMSEENWDAFRAWQVERGLQSAAAIKQLLREHDFLPLDAEAQDEESSQGHDNLLMTADMQTVSQVREAWIIVSDADIHAHGLICVGGWYRKAERQSTHWAKPTGADGEPSHQECCPVCLPRTPLVPMDDDEVPF